MYDPDRNPPRHARPDLFEWALLAALAVVGGIGLVGSQVKRPGFGHAAPASADPGVAAASAASPATDPPPQTRPAAAPAPRRPHASVPSSPATRPSERPRSATTRPAGRAK